MLKTRISNRNPKRSYMAEKRFKFIGGADDFLVTRRGKELYGQMTAEVDDDLGREVIDAAANNAGEVEAAVSSFLQAVNTLPMFGGRKVVWLKDVTFLADSVTGRAEGTQAQVEVLRDALKEVDPEQVTVLITAAPVDRRRSFWKWLNANSDCEWFGDPNDRKSGTDLPALVRNECAREKLKITDDAVEQLIGKVNGNTRLLVEEIRKLATFLGGEGKLVDEALVAEMVPTFGEGDFFEAADAFFSLDLNWTLDALRRHFFAGSDARGLISAMQGRNRLLIQLRVLLDSGEIRFGYRGLDAKSLQAAASRHSDAFGDTAEKNPFNVFTQNPWYLGRLAETAKRIPLKQLVETQSELLKAFESTLARPNAQEDVMREMALRCLSRAEGRTG